MKKYNMRSTKEIAIMSMSSFMVSSFGFLFIEREMDDMFYASSFFYSGNIMRNPRSNDYRPDKKTNG